MSQSLPTAPASRRIRPGLYQTIDPQGRVWSVEERWDTFGGEGTWSWFATCEDDRWSALDPLPRKADALAAIATID